MGKIIAKTAQLNFQAVVEEDAAGGFPVWLSCNIYDFFVHANAKR